MHFALHRDRLSEVTSVTNGPMSNHCVQALADPEEPHLELLFVSEGEAVLQTTAGTKDAEGPPGSNPAAGKMLIVQEKHSSVQLKAQGV